MNSTSHQYFFTVFTPSYNRAHTLHRVYCSLRRQTYKNFEWLIVDDGSSDDTYRLVSQWMKAAQFDIRYYYQENSGKHVAINRGVEQARGELFLIADSDDSFLSNALERFNLHWNSIPREARHQYYAVACHCLDEDGRPVGKRFPYDPTDSNSEEMLFRYRIDDEKWASQRTDVLKQFPFPEIRTACLPESYIWNRIAKKYKARFVNDHLRIYHQDAGNQIMKQSITDMASRRFYYVDSLNLSSEWFKYDPMRFIRNGIQYVRFCMLRNDGLQDQWKRLRGTVAKSIWFISLFPGLVLWMIDETKLDKG